MKLVFLGLSGVLGFGDVFQEFAEKYDEMKETSDGSYMDNDDDHTLGMSDGGYDTAHPDTQGDETETGEDYAWLNFPSKPEHFAMRVCDPNGKPSSLHVDVVFNPSVYGTSEDPIKIENPENAIVGWIRPLDNCTNCYGTPIFKYTTTIGDITFHGFKDTCVNAHFSGDNIFDEPHLYGFYEGLHMMRDCLVDAYDPNSGLEFDVDDIEFDQSFVEKLHHEFEVSIEFQEAPMRCKGYCESKVIETGLTEDAGEERYWEKVGDCVSKCVDYVVKKRDSEDGNCHVHWSTFFKGTPGDIRADHTAPKFAKCMRDQYNAMAHRKLTKEFCENAMLFWCFETGFEYMRCKRMYGKWHDGEWHADESCMANPKDGCNEEHYDKDPTLPVGEPNNGESGQCEKYNLKFDVNINEGTVTGGNPYTGESGGCPDFADIWKHDFPFHLKQKLEEISGQLGSSIPNILNPATGLPNMGDINSPTNCDDACGRKGCTSGCEMRDGEAVCVTNDKDLCSILNNCNYNGVCQFVNNEGEREAYCHCRRGFSGDTCEHQEEITEPLEVAQNIRKAIRNLKTDKFFRDSLRRLDDKTLANKCLTLLANPNEAEPASFGKCCKAGLSEIEETSPARQSIAKFCNIANVLLLKNDHEPIKLDVLKLDTDDIKENIEINNPEEIADILVVDT